MSPASSGALEVERYIGAYLISSQSRSKGNSTKHVRDQFHHREDFVPRFNTHQSQRCRSIDGWAGGIPLISFANYQRRGQFVRFQENYPLSHLAVHTQGAPLILNNKHNQRKNKSSADKNYVKTRGPSANFKPKDNRGVDAVSVNSDESSASTNSENSLPRIIKPRKRRKKDRKPSHLICPLETEDCFSTDSGSPEINTTENEIIGSHLPFIFSRLHVSTGDPLPDNISRRNHHTEIQETPKLHHKFEDVEELSKDLNENQQASLCQCRYCDPAGQIWDVQRHCYSPFLTTPIHQSDFNFPDIQETSTNHFDLSKSVNISDRGLYLKEDQIESNTFPLRSSRDLEVSTEIVTSLNGHRDLEIKFFTTPISLEKF
ncbi:hypothetical protein PPYR_06292 [Photinus pyralis]|uniref:Uncharacterized protein n=1 Tax=Photinus pyralis TaxID=7054 RepID=A0A5N4AT57_PHOPY|nr:uncharacterized protein LOC116166314 [Photinus pyralis]KAB0800552.1 hypothetical protein PPYR_06292 [Photinus pyralis]